MNKQKLYNILLFILIFVVLLVTILMKPIGNLDELWNYNFASNVSKGLIPYKDFNMVVTPLLSIVCGIILKITVNELIIMRILAVLLNAIILYIVYKLFIILEIKRDIAIIGTFIIGYLFYTIFCIDYNFLSLLIGLLIIYNEIKIYIKDFNFIKSNIKYDILLGILAGLAITTKQTSGLLISIALIGNKVLFVRGKKEFKEYIKSFAYRVIGIMIPVILMITYFCITDSFFDFIDYTILGVSEFKNIIKYSNLINWSLIGIISILVPITIIYSWIKTIILEKEKKIYILLVYGLALFVIAFPISDKIHFLVGSLPLIIIIIYELYMILYRITKRIKKLKKIGLFLVYSVKYIIIFSLIYYSILNLYVCFSKIDSYSNLKHFKYIPIDSGYEKSIIKVNKYIKENESVKILDSSAAIYMIPVDKYNKNYDMFNKGNFGENGEEKIIQEIKSSSNTKYLILKDEFKKNWQTPLNIIESVKQNRTKIGEVSIFDIYE